MLNPVLELFLGYLVVHRIRSYPVLQSLYLQIFNIMFINKIKNNYHNVNKHLPSQLTAELPYC